MLASEMVQLVPHVAGAAKPGTMYVLDMGEQIKVVRCLDVDMAKPPVDVSPVLLRQIARDVGPTVDDLLAR